jgi:hypothetical protein
MDGFMGASKDPIRQNMSGFNPVDLAAMKQSGTFTPDMKVKDVLLKIGIDPEGPATQLVEFAKKQTQNADPLAKMKNIAATAPQGQAQGQPPAEEPLPAGLDGLMNM